MNGWITEFLLGLCHQHLHLILFPPKNLAQKHWRVRINSSARLDYLALSNLFENRIFRPAADRNLSRLVSLLNNEIKGQHTLRTSSCTSSKPALIILSFHCVTQSIGFPNLALLSRTASAQTSAFTAFLTESSSDMKNPR